MTARIIPFPGSGHHNNGAVKVTIHCELDGSSIVTLRPCPAGETPRRCFTEYQDAWSYAGRLASRYSRVDGDDGSWSRSVTVTGPEGECG